MPQQPPFRPTPREDLSPARREGGGDGPEEGVAKHMKAARRANRFDPERKFGALQGRTVSHRDKIGIWLASEEAGLDMVVERPKSNDGVVLSRLDLEGCGRPELMTETPVRNGVAEELCQVLEGLAVASSIRRHPENPDVALRVFELPAAGLRRAEGVAADSSKPVPLLAAPARQAWDAEPTTYASLAVGPPEEVLEQSLMPRAKLRWSGCAELPKALHSERASRSIKPSCSAISYPTGALPCHESISLSYRNCWVQDKPEAYLEVDLGDNCNVTHVSTMGRFPPMTQYPSFEQQRMWSKEFPELAREQLRRWPVVLPGGPGWEQWVTRYELQARLEGGRQWLPVGTFKGNSDMTTEVAHDLREVCHSPEGLQCRFLRFVPTGHHGGPAMRVGVYGSAPACGKDGNASKGEQADEQRVRYLIPFPLNNRNRRRRQRTFARGGSPDWRGKYGSDYPIQRRRRLLQRATLIETREAEAANDLAGLSSGQSDDDKQERKEASERAGGDQVEPRWQPPELRRAVSQRMEEALKGPAPPLLRSITDEARGYCSEPEEVEVVDVPCSEQQEPPPPGHDDQPALLRSRTDEHRGYCSEPEEPLVADAQDSEWTFV